MLTIKLALLLCDDFPPPVLIINYYEVLFRRYLTDSLAAITKEVTYELDVYDVVVEMKYPPDSANYDGLFVSGSRATAYDNIPWINKLADYLKDIIPKKPSWKIFGICFGHQLIAKVLGSWIERGPWEVSVTPIDLTCLGKAIFRTDKLHLQMFHRDQVSKTPPNAHNLGWTDITDIQGMVIFEPESAPSSEDLKSDALCVPLTSIHILTLQGHPELDVPIMRALINEEREELGEALYEDALRRVNDPTDGIDKVGRVVWGMLGVA